VTTAKLYWLSWNQNADPKNGLDYRPVAWPPPASVLGFWQTGFAGDESYSTVVALVRTTGEARAKRIIERAWNPGVGDWRFCHTYDGIKPPGDRFPPPEWSTKLGRWPWSAQ
jgi:hypothetical protein